MQEAFLKGFLRNLCRAYTANKLLHKSTVLAYNHKI